MNERIKELLAQCRFPIRAYTLQTHDHEKFAELIVKECAEAIRFDLKKFPAGDWTWACAMEESAKIVERHFGVTK